MKLEQALIMELIYRNEVEGHLKTREEIVINAIEKNSLSETEILWVLHLYECAKNFFAVEQWVEFEGYMETLFESQKVIKVSGFERGIKMAILSTYGLDSLLKGIPMYK